jgi:hypothetical protein
MSKGLAIAKNLQNLRNQQQTVEKNMIEQKLWRSHDETQTQLQLQHQSHKDKPTTQAHKVARNIGW